jgi:hypothetical protein
MVLQPNSARQTQKTAASFNMCFISKLLSWTISTTTLKKSASRRAILRSYVSPTNSAAAETAMHVGKEQEGMQ